MKHQIFTFPIASNALVSSDVYLGGEFTEFALAVPNAASFCITATGGINVQSKLGSAYFTVGYPSSPTTSTTGFVAWNAPYTSRGSMVICDALKFCSTARLICSNTATLACDFYVVARSQ